MCVPIGPHLARGTIHRTSHQYVAPDRLARPLPAGRRGPAETNFSRPAYRCGNKFQRAGNGPAAPIPLFGMRNLLMPLQEVPFQGRFRRSLVAANQDPGAIVRSCR
uniref:Uncharacterized protein n=1 Tax=Nonomuraea gerenzanensis TaxID=93944 RepID=A0A1M4EGL5_9ACTN|nr:hypothetical protein BN4615_P7420 [Nonomuraea gerenzanensis]